MSKYRTIGHVFGGMMAEEWPLQLCLYKMFIVIHNTPGTKHKLQINRVTASVANGIRMSTLLYLKTTFTEPTHITTDPQTLLDITNHSSHLVSSVYIIQATNFALNAPC